MVECPYHDLFPYSNDAIHEKWITEWNEKNEKLKEIIPDTRPGKENNRYRKDETVINRIRARHAFMIRGYLMEGLPLPECTVYHSHAMTVRHLLTDCDSDF